MTPEQIDRVFGRGRLKMVTGEHVEVFREAVGPGERRRYTKRFLNSAEGDLAHWTEREWRILARLIGHGITCVPDVVQFDRGSVAGMQHVQTYDAGVTVDQWATLLPLHRDGQLFRHAFEDCAHWWALAHHCLAALKEVHQLQLVHLDVKGDNVCIPLGPADFDPDAQGMPLFPVFRQLALIDFAFSLVSRENLTAPLPIGWQREYDYQSPRLLQALEDGHDGDLRATRELDWRCDIYSLAAMLKRYLPDEAMVHQPDRATGWTHGRYDAAKALLLTLREHHDRDAPQVLPHQALIDATAERLREHDLALSLATGWTFARGFNISPAGASPLTPLTRLAVPLRVFVSPRSRAPVRAPAPFVVPREPEAPAMTTKRTVVLRPPSTRRRVRNAALAGAVMLALGAVVGQGAFPDGSRALLDGVRTWLDNLLPPVGSAPTSADTATARGEPAAAEPATDATNAAAAEPTTATEAAAPQVAPSSPKAALPDEAARAPGKRSTTRPVPPSPPRSSKSVAATKSPPPARLAVHAPGAQRSAKPGGSPEQAPPPPSASTQIAAVAPPAGQAASPEMPAQPSPPGPIPPATPIVTPGPQLSPAPEVHAPSAPAAPPPARRERAPAKSESPRAEPGLLSQLFGLAKRTPAPIEDRSSPVAAATGKAAAAQQPPVPSQARVASAVPTLEPPTRDRIASAAPTAEAPPGLIVTLVDESPAQARTPATQPVPPQPTARDEPKRPRAEDTRAAAAALPVPVPRMWPQPAPVPVPEALPESAYSSRARESGLVLQARRTLALDVPRIAVQAQNEVARVLWVAANALDSNQEQAVVEAAQAIGVRDNALGMSQVIEAAAARRFNDEALKAYWTRRNVAEAFDLQLRAFGANPFDPEIAGNLAAFHLKVSPAQPETARQLALHAIAVRGARYRTGRLEDWNTYAVASALTGRDADAKNALYVTVALARNVDRNCRDGANAIASYGERMREPVDAMLNRIRLQGRAYDSPHCAWPLRRSAGVRLY